MNQKAERVKNAMLCMTRQCWEQGIAAQAFWEMGNYDELELVVHDMMLRQSSDGRLCNVENTPAVTDSAFCIPAVYLLGKDRHNEKMIKAAEKNIIFLLNDAQRATDGTLYHMIHTKHVWADSAAYLPYALALTGHVEEGFVQMKGICSRLYDKETGLYLHMWDDERQEYLRALPWGIGNGWILSGMLRLYLVAGEECPKGKAVLLQEWHTLLDTMLIYETDAHLFHDILTDDTTFEESETAELVAYCIYCGIREGLLEWTYLQRADKIRAAIEKRVTESGLVKGAASSPDFVRPGTSVECQANYLMMEKAFDMVRNCRKTNI